MSERMPKQVGIRELKAHLSTYVKWAEAGHDITITDHRRPAARLVAPYPTSADVMPASLRLGIAEGWITPGRTRRPLRPIDRVASSMTIEQLLADDRGAE